MAKSRNRNSDRIACRFSPDDIDYIRRVARESGQSDSSALRLLLRLGHAVLVQDHTRTKGLIAQHDRSKHIAQAEAKAAEIVRKAKAKFPTPRPPRMTKAMREANEKAADVLTA